MRKNVILVALASTVACAGAGGLGCAKAGTAAAPTTPQASQTAVSSTDAPVAKSPEPADGRASSASSTWIGAAPEGDVLATGTRDTFVGVWVDVPEKTAAERPPMELSLVVDTSGSMAGAKIDNARSAAAMLVRNLKTGDIVALDSFSDHARVIVPPTVLDANTRAQILRKISELKPEGSTNMFEGLSLAESQVQMSPETHPLRRVVVISDGIANVGPASPDVLGALAERGLRNRAQVTSLGVGVDYDERTLDALAVRSSGRLYHLSEPSEMASILGGELKMLDATIASDATVEIVPAPGVAILGADGARSEWSNGALRIPLGALFAGQHREALVRVQITDPSAFQGHSRSLASVRLKFRDASDGDLERIQEVLAKTELSEDSAKVARSVSSRTKAIAAILDASKNQLDAAQRINDGNFVDADKELARAQATLSAQAQVVTAPVEKKRLEAAADKVAATRRAAGASASAPKAVQLDRAKQVNADAMHESGF